MTRWYYCKWCWKPNAYCRSAVAITLPIYQNWHDTQVQKRVPYFRKKKMKPYEYNRLGYFYQHYLLWHQKLNEHCDFLPFQFCQSNYSIHHSLLYPLLVNLHPASFFSEILVDWIWKHRCTRLFGVENLCNCHQRTTEETVQWSASRKQTGIKSRCGCISLASSGPC